jgi:hypothetical protein
MVVGGCRRMRRQSATAERDMQLEESESEEELGACAVSDCLLKVILIPTYLG